MKIDDFQPSDVGSAQAAPEGVVILGMHRSGTSLITRLVNLMGVAVCRDDDLVVGMSPNPRGHWESRSLIRFNIRLLRELGGSWHYPPRLDPRRAARMVREHGSEALATLEHAHPVSPWVWKDPRTCVLMPFWSAVLNGRVVYVLVVRHPFEVSDSLARRNGFTPALSLALWERYTREAMFGAAGRPLMVCTYDGILADPSAWCERLAAFLGAFGLRTHPVDRLTIDAFVMDELRHSHRSWTDLRPGPLISQQQVALAVALARAANTSTVQSSYVPPPLPAETPETEAIFRQIRRNIAFRRIRRRIPSRKRLRRRKPPEGPWRRTPAERWTLANLPARLVDFASLAVDAHADAPPVSVVLARSSAAAIEASILTLGATLPAGSELLTVGAGQAPAGAQSSLGDVALRHVACDRAPGEAGALALGVNAARGRIVLLTTGNLARCDPWYAPAERMFAALNVGGLGPVIRFDSDPEVRCFGRAFADEDLTAHQTVTAPAGRAITGQAGERPVPAALLSDVHCVFPRMVLVAAGGVDGHFSSAQAAVAELSLRLWRLGFRCCILPQVEVWGESPERDGAEDDAEHLYDRLRIATLHFDPARLQAFTDRASHLPSYGQACQRLAASDVQRRRAEIEAICAFSADRYFHRFPLRPVTPQHQ